ncbi:MAG: class I SAM-dependent methyltransferase [Phycisphaerae bacterium]|nr:class I SAM-dependent methyltransferase [Phycisphaerae bacterium]
MTAPSDETQGDVFCCVSCGHDQAIPRPEVPSDPTTRPFDLVRCAACGLVQQHPRCSDKQLATLYDEGYYVFAEDESTRWARAVQQYAVHILPWETAMYRRLLEVGCAAGHLSALADRRGWRVVGIDVSPEAISRAAVRFGLDFRAGLLAQHRQALPPCDLVFLGDVLEHVPAPIAFLAEIRKVLAPDGAMCIDTPNWDSRWRRWGRTRWLGLNRFHVNLFDADSLTGLLDSCGFGDIETRSYTHFRYESWANRPEMQAYVQKMPGPLAWRINRFLDRRSGRSQWAVLREHPPATLDDALRLLDELAKAPRLLDTLRHDGDNLVATAKRGCVTV